ncbi:hypothetical protein [Actinomadura mexicana]|uniref:Neocarzinostatin family protein n=1 Tax=Actinomadura mexicana TaxID=134959 RepID=A0A238UYW4_9ACTN|nr:hypothetical protein [Actinomadura mexicana]SNR26947.1 hypothetical protein SAMN06265355_101597 [Actinomadura mexicana]
MRKIAQKAVTATAVVASAIALTAAPAPAALLTSVTINPTGTNIALSAVNSGNIVGANDRTGVALICTGLTATGVLPSGGGPLSPIHIAKVTGVTFSGCTVLGNPATVTATASAANPWWLDVTGNTAAGVTPGKLTGVDVHIVVPALNCTGDANGAGSAVGVVPGTHTDRVSAGAPSKLKLPPPPNQGDNIEMANVSATCPASIAKNNDPVTLAGTLNITPGLTVLAT